MRGNMKIIACVDIRGGLAFNHRRQSRDSVVVKDILSITEGKRLIMTPYSAKLFGDAPVSISDSPLTEAGEDDFCFVELIDPTPYTDFASQLVLYCWNVKYPFDVSLSLDLSKWRKIHTSNLVGTSHDKIIKEIYEK